MSKQTIKNLMMKTPLDGLDATRLVLECIEGLGIRAEGVTRLDLLALVRRVMREGIAVVESAERTVTFEVAAWESVLARSDRRPTTRRDLRHYVRRMLRIEWVSHLPLRAMSTAQCRDMLKSAFGHSPHSYRKARAILHSIFAYGMRREWCDANPVDRIEVPSVEEKTIEPLSNEEVERLCKVVQKNRRFVDMRFSLSLLLYGGVRPAEVERLQLGDVCWDERQVIIRPLRSKTGGGRVVPLRLIPGMRQQDCFIPRNWVRRWRALRRAAGFRSWVSDVCRHTFASYHAAYFRNLPELQLEMGHRDVSLLQSRYMAPALRKIAKEFWSDVLKL